MRSQNEVDLGSEILAQPIFLALDDAPCGSGAFLQLAAAVTHRLGRLALEQALERFEADDHTLSCLEGARLREERGTRGNELEFSKDA